MSKVAISGNASGTGVFTIASPNSNTDRTLNLPDNSGTLLSNASTAGFPAGSVLQVVSVAVGAATSTTSATPVATSLAATITPTAASSKILVLVDTQVTTATSGNGVGILLYRNGSLVKTTAADSGPRYYTNYNYSATVWVQQSMMYLDSPSAATATTYTVYVASYSSGSTATLGGGGSTVYPSTITLMEIAA
jgi:hypothetical protein